MMVLVPWDGYCTRSECLSVDFGKECRDRPLRDATTLLLYLFYLFSLDYFSSVPPLISPCSLNPSCSMLVPHTGSCRSNSGPSPSALY